MVTAVATSSGSERIRTMSAVSIATSVPAPIAIPTSAWANAGASLTPSPTIATLLPARCSSPILLALSAGRTSAITCRIPSSRAIRSAVARLSPVSITTSTPCSWIASTAALAVGRGASLMPITAEARPSTATTTTVRPSAAISSRVLASPLRLIVSRAISLALPTATRRPPTVARAPWPGTFSKSVAESWAAPTCSARRTIASASGCSESRSTAAARARTSFSDKPSAVSSVTSGSPLVSVPVLSITTTWTRAAASIAAAFLKRIPRLAPSPVPTMMAVGVARPRASGQVITTTVMANRIAWLKLRPASNQTINVSVPPISATSTSQKAARSASCCPGAFELWASCTSLTMWARAVSEPTFVARARSVPFLLIEPPINCAFGAFETGRLSPVTTDSSTSLMPSSTTASTGTLEPGLMRTTSPTCSSDVGTSTCSSSLMTIAIGGARFKRARTASLAPPRARISSQWPRSTKAARTVDAS